MEMDFFDDDNEVFIKLHKKTSDKDILYWEVWNEDEKTAMTHWGKVGHNGDKKEVKSSNNTDLRAAVNKEINKYIADGYEDVPYENYYLMVLTFEMESLGEVEDLQRMENLRGIVTESLGWSGNGNCDECEIQEDKTILYADVLNSEIALQAAKAAFKKEGLTGDFFVTVMQEEDILVENKKVTLR
jgi:predicted DNA-binding WGR domain protein